MHAPNWNFTNVLRGKFRLKISQATTPPTTGCKHHPLKQVGVTRGCGRHYLLVFVSPKPQNKRRLRLVRKEDLKSVLRRPRFPPTQVLRYLPLSHQNQSQTRFPPTVCFGQPLHATSFHPDSPHHPRSKAIASDTACDTTRADHFLHSPQQHKKRTLRHTRTASSESRSDKNLAETTTSDGSHWSVCTATIRFACFATFRAYLSARVCLATIKNTYSSPPPRVVRAPIVKYSI